MTGIILALGYTALLLFVMRRMPFYTSIPGLPMRAVAGLFILKILAGTALWAVYTWVYTDRMHADVFKFFDDSAVMFSALPDRPMDLLRMLFSVGNDNAYFDERYYKVMNHWYREYESNLANDAHTIIRFNAAVRLLSFGEFHVHTVFAAFLALTGMLAIHRAFVDLLPGRERALVIAVLLVPSVLFWASGVIKESLLFFGMGLMLWQFLRLLSGELKFGGLLLLISSAILLFHLKFYVIASLLPALAMLTFSHLSPRTPLLLRSAMILLACVTLGLNLHHLLPGFNVLETLAVKQRDFIGLAEATAPGSFVPPERLEPNAWSFVRRTPYALYVTLLGPLVHPGPGFFGIVAALEQLLLLLVIGILLMYRLPWIRVEQEMLVPVLTFVLLLALVIGWTTPVMGAIVRYRTPMLPFLLIAVLLLTDHRKLLARWPKLKPFISA